VAAKKRGGKRSGSSRESGARSGSRARARKSGRARSGAARARTPAAADELVELPESLRSSLELELPSDKLYYRIGEVAEIADVEAYVLRYWETEFKWMAPQKSRSNQRLYKPKDIELILLIKHLLYTERYTIAGARQRLRELGVTRALAEARTAGIKAPREAKELQAAVRRVRHQLEALRDDLSAAP